MSQTRPNGKDKQEAMKTLRESRKEQIETATAKMKAQKKAIREITDQLEAKARTVPELAAATGASTADTLWYIAALKKYGKIIESEKDGSYFKYALANVEKVNI